MALGTAYRAGRHFLQIPGPTPVPDRVMRAMAMPVIDHRGPDFPVLAGRALEGIKSVFKTSGPVVIYPSSGTGAWEAALANTLSPGDRVLMFETGHFATLWQKMALALGLQPEFIDSDWRVGADPCVIESRLREDKQHLIKAVCVVHNETSTGCVTHVKAIRQAIDAAGHPALLMVDTISSLACMDYCHEAWGVDVSLSGSQKGLMLPPGLSMIALSPKALAAAKTARLPRQFWRWDEILTANERGYFPYTPATTLLYGLVEAIDMLHEEGLTQVFARHSRHAEATRRAVEAWGLEVLCRDPQAYSSSLTAVRLADEPGADHFRRVALQHFDISLGSGLGKLQNRVFRIGHLGSTNDLTIIGALSGVEMGLDLAGVSCRKGGVQAAIDFLVQTAKQNSKPEAERPLD